MKMMVVLAAAFTTAACMADPNKRDVAGAPLKRVPVGAAIERSGYATILAAPPPPYRNVPQPVEPQEQSAEARAALRIERMARRPARQMNPDRETRDAARRLIDRLRVGARGNFVDASIERDPDPHYVFHFRRDAAATLARFTDDPSFRAREGGIPPEELEPIVTLWDRRFREQRLVLAGSRSAIEGYAVFYLGVSKAEYDAIAAREGWRVPERVRLKFAPSLDAVQAVAPELRPLVRVFARAQRVIDVDFATASNGILVLRDGCFRVGAAADAPLALFGRNIVLDFDQEGFAEVRSLTDPDDRGRVGEWRVEGASALATEREPGFKELRERCGSGPILVLREPWG